MTKFVDVYAYNEQGLYVGCVSAQKDKKGQVMLPAGATEKEPLVAIEGCDIVFDGNNWVYVQKEAESSEEMPVEHEEVSYQQKRAAAYPFVGDQLDAIYKGLKELSKTVAMPNDVESWFAQIEAVKAMFPKDEGSSA